MRTWHIPKRPKAICQEIEDKDQDANEDQSQIVTQNCGAQGTHFNLLGFNDVIKPAVKGGDRYRPKCQTSDVDDHKLAKLIGDGFFGGFWVNPFAVEDIAIDYRNCKGERLRGHQLPAKPSGKEIHQAEINQRVERPH